MSVVTSRRCEMRCNVWERYDLVTCYNRGFQFCDIVLMYRIWSSQNAREFFFSKSISPWIWPPTRKSVANARNPPQSLSFHWKRREQVTSGTWRTQADQAQAPEPAPFPAHLSHTLHCDSCIVIASKGSLMGWAKWRTQCIATVARSCRYCHNTVDRVVDITNVGIKGPRVYF